MSRAKGAALLLIIGVVGAAFVARAVLSGLDPDATVVGAHLSEPEHGAEAVIDSGVIEPEPVGRQPTIAVPSSASDETEPMGETTLLRIALDRPIAAKTQVAVQGRSGSSGWRSVLFQDWSPEVRIPRPVSHVELRVIAGDRVGHAVASNDDEFVDVTLHATSAVSGTVVNQSGTPVPNASVYVREAGAGGLPIGARIDELAPSAKTDVRGRFAVDGLRGGRDVLIRAGSDWSWTPSDVRAASGDDQVVVELTAYRVAAFRAVDSVGRSAPLVLSNGRLGFSLESDLFRECIFVDAVSAPPGDFRQLARDLAQIGALGLAFEDQVIGGEIEVTFDLPGFVPLKATVPVLDAQAENLVTDVVLQGDGTPLVDLRVSFVGETDLLGPSPRSNAGRLNLIRDGENVFVTIPRLDEELVIRGLRPEPYQWSVNLGIGFKMLPETGGAPAPKVDLSVERTLEIEITPSPHVSCVLIHESGDESMLYDGLARITVAPLSALHQSDAGAWFDQFRIATFTGSPYIIQGLKPGSWVISPFGNNALEDGEYQIVELSAAGGEDLTFKGQFSPL